MSNEIKNIWAQYKDAAGEPLGAGTLTIYKNLTVSPKAIYSDEALTIPQSNPYTLDASGRVAGDIKYTGVATVVVKDVNGATVRTDDNVKNPLDLGAAADQDYNGSATIGQRLDNLDFDSVEDLVAVTISQIVDGDTVMVASFYGGWAATAIGPCGGGKFVWDANYPKSNHNGGTVISPTVPWTSTMANYLTGVGETDSGGNGCFRRVIVDDHINVKWFGAKGDGDAGTDDVQAINEAIKFMNTLTLGGTVTGGTLFFPYGRYMVSASVDFESYQRCLVRGEGFGSQIYPSTTGYNTVRMVTTGANNIAVEMHNINVFVNNSQVGVQWEYHQGGIFNCYVTPVSSPASSVTAIQLDQTASNTGSWITKIRDCRIDFAQAATATNCTGIDIIGAANACAITGNTIAGFNGTGIRIGQYAVGADTQMVLISDNDIESMVLSTQINIAVDVQGVASRISVIDNYFEGIEGAVASRFIRVGAIADVRGLVFQNNYCLTDNPRPAGFIGVEFRRAISPNLESNFYAPPGAGDYLLAANYNRTITNITQANPGVVTTSTAHGYFTGQAILHTAVVGMTEVNNQTYDIIVLSPTTYSIVDTTGFTAYSSAGTATTTYSTTMGIPNQLEGVIKDRIELMDTEMGSNQTAGSYTNISTASTRSPITNSMPFLATLEVVYAAGSSSGTVSFILQKASGGTVAESEIIDTTPSATIRKVQSGVFYAGYGDLAPLQAQSTGGQTWQIYSANLIIHSA
jgi:hypothetical protein